MHAPTSFSFISRRFDPATRTGSFTYETAFADGPALSFTETVAFPDSIDPSRVPPALLERLFDALHLMLGISYYKLYCPPQLKVPYALTEDQALFWNTVYRKGLGEFAYRNSVDVRGIAFPVGGAAALAPFDVPTEERALVGIGGGKDSIVALELLRGERVPVQGFVVETYTAHDIAAHVCEVAEIGLTHIVRTLDSKVLSSVPGAYKGHIPISAVYAFLGYAVALMSGFRYVVTGNEWSSNFGNALHYGEEVNHQWSKSMEFEQLFTAFTSANLSPSVRYFSLLRPFHEIRIAELFAKHPKYFPVFTSCNRKFRIDPAGRPGGMWCGECPKCAFVFLMLAPFLGRDELVALYGTNMLADPGLVPLFGDILGFGDMKPFDCVGTFDEARAALFLVRDRYADSIVVREFAPQSGAGPELVARVMHVARAPSVPHRFRFAGMRDVLIMGYGKEGAASERFIAAQYPMLSRETADASHDPAYLERQGSADLVVKTAGMPKQLITAHYTTATNQFFARWKGKSVGVTGSKGKSTTASLVHAMLVEAGKDARLVGNIGTPALDLLNDAHDAETIAVVELSSYQLDDIEHSPHVAVVTALFPEHMDYHGGLEQYFAAKQNITRFQRAEDAFVFDPADKRAAAWARESRARAVPLIKLMFDRSVVPLLGDHNEHNVRVAATAAHELGVPDAAIERAVRNFKGLKHRLELVGEFRGIRFYDDAISTTPESTIAALHAVPGVATIFLGGHDRGYDFASLEHELRVAGVRSIVLFPESGARMLADRAGFTILETSSMREAVAFAYAQTPPGAACLLSCASPSYGLWTNFEEKGDAFSREVYNQSV